MADCVADPIDPGECRGPLGSAWRFDLVQPFVTDRREDIRLLARFTGKDLSGKVTYRENELSETETTVPDGDWCTQALASQINDMAPHVEGWWFRNNQRVHVGPAIDFTDNGDGTIRIVTRDRMWWEEADTPLGVISVEDEDLTRLWLKYITPRLLHLRQNAVCAGIMVTRELDPEDFVSPTALDAAKDIAEEGLSWTVVDDSLTVGPIDRVFKPPSHEIYEGDWIDPPAFSVNGERFADRFVCVGSRELETRPTGFWPPLDQPSPADRWIRSVRVVEDEQIRTTGQATARAKRAWIRRHHSDTLIAPRNTSLAIAPIGERGLPWCPHTLLPGRVLRFNSGSRLASGPVTMVPTDVTWEIANGRDASCQPALRSIHE